MFQYKRNVLKPFFRTPSQIMSLNLRTGVSSLISEIEEQMQGAIPDCFIVSVGGGGLICGVIEGLIKNNWINHNIKVIAVETEGCDCFNKSTKEKTLITLDKISRYYY